ncbi:hypothetical protein JB92DRAFT_3118741 [Gautieria morchelliformis]|nr:hypothetical protein JB92DRAFT_3118741 [Gautieria morchelliformis]
MRAPSAHWEVAKFGLVGRDESLSAVFFEHHLLVLTLQLPQSLAEVQGLPPPGLHYRPCRDITNACEVRYNTNASPRARARYTRCGHGPGLKGRALFTHRGDEGDPGTWQHLYLLRASNPKLTQAMTPKQGVPLMGTAVPDRVDMPPTTGNLIPIPDLAPE